MQVLKTDYTEVWTPSVVKPLIRFADRVQSIASTGLDLLGVPGIDPPAQLIDRLRGFDSIVSWYGANRSDLREEVARLALPFQFFPALPPPGCSMHVIDFFLQHAGGTPGQKPHIEVEPRPHGAIVIHPFSGSARKNLPLATFRAVAAELPGQVEWCAGPHEPLPGAVRIANLYELACWLAGARLFIGNDCGIAHLAAAAGTPVVAVFGPTDPAMWAPRGERVRIVAGDLEKIDTKEILDAVAQIL